jgi:glutamate racemase
LEVIGVLDSGIGGLTILKNLINMQLDAEFYYISDTDNVPYGGKSQEFMLERTVLMIEELLRKDVTTILIACNTLTAETIDQLRNKYKVNFVGIEPYLNYINSHNFKIDDSLALILTEATFFSNRFTNLREKLDPNGEVDVYPLKNLAIIIEKICYKNLEELKADIDDELKILNGKNYSHLILGCTHYPIIADYIEQVHNLKTVNPHINVVDRIIDQAKLKINNIEKHKFWYNPKLSNEWKLVSIQDFKFLQNKQE